MPESPKTVIGVPGCWAGPSDIVTSIVSKSGGYLFSGRVMLEIATRDHFTLEVYQHDPNLRHAFTVAGGGRLTEEDLAAIGGHTVTLYLVGEGGSVAAAKKFLRAANALLTSGGLAVKVESTGTAHRADQWAEFCARDDLGSLLRAYVTYVRRGPGVYYSCGMHNLGLPDAVVEADIPPDEAGKLLFTFLGYLLVEEPRLKARPSASTPTRPDTACPTARVRPTSRATCSTTRSACGGWSRREPVDRWFERRRPFHRTGGRAMNVEVAAKLAAYVMGFGLLAVAVDGLARRALGAMTVPPMRVALTRAFVASAVGLGRSR